MSAPTASHAAHGGHEAHDEHGHGGIDPMKLRIGILLGVIVFIVSLVSVFSYGNISLAGVMPVKAKNPIILPAQSPAQLANACDNFVFEYMLTGIKKCR